jgi:hypothetical protein
MRLRRDNDQRASRIRTMPAAISTTIASAQQIMRRQYKTPVFHVEINTFF